MPLPATLFAPAFVLWEQPELQPLLNALRYPLVTHLFFLITAQCDFKTGELITNYPRLIELCTPPAPERGRRLPAPTLKQLRTAMQWLEDHRLIKRNKDANESQGVLRLHVTSVERRARKATSKTKKGRV